MKNKIKHHVIAPFLIVVTGVLAFAAVPVDNTAMNRRDTMNHEATADQQGLSKNDTEITRRIRQAIIQDKSMSTYAQNIKVITIRGEVTLKGPVKTIEEQQALVQKAQAVAGVKSVYNQIDVAAR